MIAGHGPKRRDKPLRTHTHTQKTRRLLNFKPAFSTPTWINQSSTGLHACVSERTRSAFHIPVAGEQASESSVTARLNERTGCCSRRWRNRTDGLPRLRLPLLESNAGRQRKQRDVRKADGRQRRKNTNSKMSTEKAKRCK